MVRHPMIDQVVIGSLTNSIHIECIRERHRGRLELSSAKAQDQHAPLACTRCSTSQPLRYVSLTLIDANGTLRRIRHRIRPESLTSRRSHQHRRGVSAGRLRAASGLSMRRARTVTIKLLPLAVLEAEGDEAQMAVTIRVRLDHVNHDRRTPGLELRSEVVTVPTWQPRGGRAASVAPSASPSSCNSSWCRAPARLRRRRSRRMAPSLSIQS